MIAFFRKLGPGFVFAGAAIGVSHLVQSTRAGADFGFGLLWALLLINAIKYPFFEFGPRYASATGTSLIEGYRKLGKGVLILYYGVTFASMFTIQTAVTVVTAGIASSLFGSGSVVLWTAIVTGVCTLILLVGRYRALDQLMKLIVLCLTVSTIIAVLLISPTASNLSLAQVFPTDTIAIGFLIAFMGWMPAPLDISIWHSTWTLEKKKIDASIDAKQSRFDFNIGYLTTTFLALGFLALGALVMFQSGASFSTNGTQFANQLIDMYAYSLGDWARLIIGIAALTTMFSTTLTTLDASPRVMHQASEVLFKKSWKRGYMLWLSVLVAGTLAIFFFFIAEMGTLIQIATVLSFLTAPFYAIANYALLTGKHTPEAARPSQAYRTYAGIGILLLVAFSGWYITTLF